MTTRHTDFQAIGTQWDIEVYDTVTAEAWKTLQHHIQRRIAAFDAAYSRFRADSLVTRMFEKPGQYDLPPDGFALLRFYEQLYEITAGKVTPLIGQTLVAAGYDAEYSFTPGNMTSPPRWEDTLTYTKQHITLKAPVLLDFGAAGKGYLVDLVAELIEHAGISSYVVNAGGDIRQRSTAGNRLTVGLENPLDTTEAIGTATVVNQSLCASAGSKRKWGEFHHIINPSSLRSPRDIIATWVTAEGTMMADGLATALFFTSPSRLQAHYNFSYAVLHKDMAMECAADFPAALFEAGA